jgi:hypothetical protein
LEIPPDNCDRKEVDVVERDVIGHLIDVERQASDLMLEALAEADRRKKAARDAADDEYRAAAGKAIDDIDRSYAASCAECDETVKRDFSAFTARLDAMSQDRASFNARLDSFLGR